MTSTISRARRAAVALATTALAAGTMTGCGSSSTASTTTASGSVAGAQPSGSAQRARRFDPAQQQKIEQCLAAAGLPVPTFSPRPSGSPRPSFTRTGDPSARPSGGLGGRFNDPKVRAALQACGITVPTGRPSGAGGPGTAGGGQAGATPTQSA